MWITEDMPPTETASPTPDHAVARPTQRSGHDIEEMKAYGELREREPALEDEGYAAIRNQREIGAGCCDDIPATPSVGITSTLAPAGSSNEQQF
jgi:isocitrate lyase